MSNLRWVRLNRTQLLQVPADVEKYMKLVNEATKVCFLSPCLSCSQEILSVTHNSLKEVHGIAPPSFPALKVHALPRDFATRLTVTFPTHHT